MKKAGHKELRVYQLAYELSLKIQILTKSFPFEERFSLTDQIRRSSRSVCANIGEGYRKRQYPKNFAKKLSDSNGEDMLGTMIANPERFKPRGVSQEKIVVGKS